LSGSSIAWASVRRWSFAGRARNRAELSVT
jgi:hypothetical protein